MAMHRTQHIVEHVETRKRKTRDDDSDADDSLGLAIGSVNQIVEQIFNDAAAVASTNATMHCHPNMDNNRKRPKIFKLDQNDDANEMQTCGLCNLAFNSTAKLLMHQNKYHNNGSSTECPICCK
jgi:hypothetical protein